MEDNSVFTNLNVFKDEDLKNPLGYKAGETCDVITVGVSKDSAFVHLNTFNNI